MYLVSGQVCVVASQDTNASSHSQGPNVRRDPSEVAMNQLLFSIFFYMSYSNKCVNFFLYLVSGYKFRLALRQLVRCRRQVFTHLSMGGGGGGAVGVGGGGGEGFIFMEA